jgi:lysophospholipase L1-like esterase
MTNHLIRAWPILFALLGGALLGEAAWWGGVQVRTAEAPPGLLKRDWQLPHHLAALTGDLPPDPAAWSLSFHSTMVPGPGAGLSRPTPVSGTALLPEAGRLEVFIAAVEGPQGVQGVGLVLDRLAPARSEVVMSQGQTRRRLRCTAPLPPPGDGPTAFSIQAAGDGVRVTVAGVSTQCQAQLPPAGPIIRSGLRRVQISGLSLDGNTLPAPGPGRRALWWAIGAAAIGLLGAGLRLLGWRGRSIAICLCPLLLCGWLSGQELAAWAESARVLWLPVPWLGALIPAAISAGLIALVGLAQILREGAPDWRLRTAGLAGLGLIPAALIIPSPPAVMSAIAAGIIGAACSAMLLAALARVLRSTSPARTASIACGMGSLLSLGIALTHPIGLSAIAYGFGLGALGTLLVWVNMNPRVARWYNLTAFILALGLIGCLEVVLRFTVAGQAWSGARAGPMGLDIFSEVENTERELSLFDSGQPTAYPTAGYPVSVPAPTGAIRVITAGSSSTGGAYQNDQLSDFYPARMQELLGPSHQVINQGVGGWTTFHIDRYLTTQIEVLQPDVLTLYVGHNDQLTALPRPIREIYSRMQRPGAGAKIAAQLAQFRLYQGLRYSVASMRSAQDRTAVPLDHARANLTHLIRLMADRGGRVVLASEGLSPDPGPLVPYFQMMEELAQAHDHVLYLDTAAALHQQPPAGVFLDDSHLTDRGHRLVAAMLTSAITEGAPE